MIAGLLMFHERWFQIGDTVELEPLSIAGVVEDATLRTVTMRNVAGEVIRVSNSEVKAIRVLPRGYRQVEAELFVTDADAGCELVRQVGGLVPTGPDTLHPPADRRRDRPARGRPAPDPCHCRGPARPRVARRGSAPELHARASSDDLIVHGPVVMWADEHAEHRFARVTRTPVAARRR